MRDQFDVFITVDKNLMFQRDPKNFLFALIVLRAKTNKIEDLRPLIAEMRSALNTIGRGEVVRIESWS